MPPEFSDFKTKYQKNSVDNDWIHAKNMADLYIQLNNNTTYLKTQLTYQLDTMYHPLSMIQVPSQSTIKVPVSFAMSIPSHLQLELRPRSSLSLKGIALGTIDPDY